MIDRPYLRQEVEFGLQEYPVTAILGPRQCGKTTLARSISKRIKAHYFDLEDPTDQARLSQPKQLLEKLEGIVVLDEIQQKPELTKLLRVLADRVPLPCRFLILGSASPELMRQSSDSLAGRVHFVDMEGFTLQEVGGDESERLWIRGGFPRSFLAKSESRSMHWRENFMRTFLERDLPQLGVRMPVDTLRRFWTMVAHYHGQIWNGSEIGASLGVSHHTTRKYLDLLCGAYVLRQLPPWFENVGKRVVKSPKVYVRDSGILHALLGIEDRRAVFGHPKLGASWEGYVIEQILSVVGDRHAFFWATHGRAELDLLLLSQGRRWGFEIKFGDAPTLTKSMRIVNDDLDLEQLWVVYPGNIRYSLADNIEVIPLCDLDTVCQQLK